MRLIPPGTFSTVRTREPVPVVRPGRVSRPQWLVEWLANQAKYAKLACGCIDDLTIQPLWFQSGGIALVWCDRCARVVSAVRSATAREYMSRKYGLTFVTIPVKPLF